MLIRDESIEGSPDSETPESKRVLEPLERISEILFGLIIVLTFTCTIKAKETGRGEVRAILIEALGCCLAWAIIDAVFYLLGCLSKRGRGYLLLEQLRSATDPVQARRTISVALPTLIAAHLPLEAFESLRHKLTQLTDLPTAPRLTKDDWLGALGVFLLACAAVFPLVIPFVFMSDLRLALYVSHGIVIVLLFLAGYALGRHSSRRPWRVAVAMVVLGCALIGVALLLGG
jgi:hypothetical protein